MIENNPQLRFIAQLKASLPGYQNFARRFADALDISINEAYKKIRGESSLNLSQLVALADSFRVPFLYSPAKFPSVTFDYMHTNMEKPDMLAYLQDLLDNLKQIHRRDTKHITITTDDIPLFHFFKYPELTGFKLFFWANGTIPDGTKFNEIFLSPEILSVSQELHQLYLEIPSTEIWSKDTIHGTIEQIRYAVEAGYISDKGLAVAIVEQLRYCLTDMNMYAIGSKKTIDPSHRFNWYNCDVLGSISYLVEFKESMLCFNRFNTFNYLKTEDQFYCGQTKDWMQGLITKSVSFSGQGEKHRNKYLYDAFSACDTLIKEINN